MSSQFRTKVLQVVKRVPRGSTMTYGEVALLAGHAGAARAVGSIMKTNFDRSVPCHRVIRANGKIGEYNRGGSKRKQQLLHQEGAI